MTSRPPLDPQEVLVIDDDPDIRYTLRFLLEGASYTVYEAPDGQPALEQLRTLPRGTVVLLEWNMPGMDGAALLRALAADLPRAARHAYLVLTACARVGVAQVFPLTLTRALPPVAAQVLSKPVEVDRLLAAVEDAANHLRSIEQSDQAILPSPLACRL